MINFSCFMFILQFTLFSNELKCIVMSKRKNIKIRKGDNLKKLAKYPDNHFDSIVTDPPYGLGKEPKGAELVAMLTAWTSTGYYEIKGGGFMGKKWDAFVPQPIFWKEVFRVLKPGGHVLSFFGTRTYHWGVLAMTIAGFEVRDRLQWLFEDGRFDGFIDGLNEKQRREFGGLLRTGENEYFWNYGSGFPKSHNISKAIDKDAGADGTTRNGTRTGTGTIKPLNSHVQNPKITAPATPDAEKWDGWGSAIKPANEPIVLCRKPIEGRIVDNVLKWGTGGLNIDACRIGTEDNTSRKNNKAGIWSDKDLNFTTNKDNKGRFPANVIHDGSKTVMDEYAKYGVSKSSGGTGGGSNSFNLGRNNARINSDNVGGLGDSGTAARYFYAAKASKKERGEGNTHPTVKPIALIKYLIKLITPPNGKTCDPFAGSGTAGVAVNELNEEGYNIHITLMEQSKEYVKIIKSRV